MNLFSKIQIHFKGSSGAGKSTLMNCLTSKNTESLKISGSIRVNGVDIKENISKVSAYIQQRDDFVGVLKVEEHLEFYSRLKLSKISKNQRKQKIEEVVSLMGLKNCLKTEIGVPGLTKTISGGEMKRPGYFNFVQTNAWPLRSHTALKWIL